MRITTLTLKNFRSHVETLLELDRYNFIRGPNGCGKTSIQMALELLFTGRCAMTDAAGRGADSLIRFGAKEFSVSATLQNGETICRRKSARSHVVELNGNRVPVEAAERYLEKQFASSDVLSALLNASRFTEMTDEERKRLLLQVVDAGRVKLPQDIADTLRAIGAEPPRGATVEGIEDMYRRCYDARTEANRAFRLLGHMEKPVVPADLPNSQEVKKALEDWRHQKELLIGQGAQAKAAWETAQERLKAVEGEIQEISSEILSATEEQQLRQLESQRDRAEKLLRELTELMAKQKAVETSLATLEGLRGKCPACRQSIPDEVRNRETETLGGQLAELDDAIQGTKEELGEYSGMESASTRLEDHRKALTRQAKLMEEQAKLHGFQSPNATDFESKMTILGEKIGKAERLLRMYTRQKASGNGGVRTSWNGRSWRSESLCWIGW